MNEGLARLTEREREVLRLLGRGHDGKSSARALGISIHSVNERLRDARRKLGVPSSREAARILAAHEGRRDNFLGDEEIGLGGIVTDRPDRGEPPGPRTMNGRHNWKLAGGMVMLLVIAAFVGLSFGQSQREALPVLSAGEGQAPIMTLRVPQVVSTSPRPRDVIRPGPFVLSVTYDTPMREDNYSFVRASAETYPECQVQPSLSPDKRTYALRCVALPGKTYELWFNRPPYMNFKSSRGVPAKPFRLSFRASR